MSPGAESPPSPAVRVSFVFRQGPQLFGVSVLRAEPTERSSSGSLSLCTNTSLEGRPCNGPSQGFLSI